MSTKAKIHIDDINPDEVINLGRSLLLNYRDKNLSFEKASQLVCQKVYENFYALNDPAFILVRIFRTFRWADLPSELSGLAQPDGDYCLALMGSYGDEPEWCDRHASRGHQVLNAGNHSTPMVKAMIEQLGIIPGNLSAATPQPLEMNAGMIPTFYVANAVGSPLIPAQDGFVSPYGVQSVMGIGTTFLSKMAYVSIIFARTPISSEQRNVLATLGPYISTLVMTEQHLGM